MFRSVSTGNNTITFDFHLVFLVQKLFVRNRLCRKIYFEISRSPEPNPPTLDQFCASSKAIDCFFPRHLTITVFFRYGSFPGEYGTWLNLTFDGLWWPHYWILLSNMLIKDNITLLLRLSIPLSFQLGVIILASTRAKMDVSPSGWSNGTVSLNCNFIWKKICQTYYFWLGTKKAKICH